MTPAIRSMMALLTTLVLGGCASTPRFPVEDISQPALNVTRSAYLGERLLMQTRGYRSALVQVQSLRGNYVRINEQTFCQRAQGSKDFYSFDDNAVTYLKLVGGYRGRGSKSQPNALQRIIEYNGKAGDTLNFTYRVLQNFSTM